jgi:hypothetical protein
MKSTVNTLPALGHLRTLATATVASLVIILSGCASMPQGNAPKAASGQSVNREVAKLELKSRLADDSHWEQVLSLPRTHARFVVLRDAIRANLLSDETLNWYSIANEILPQYPGVTAGNLYNFYVSKGLMRLSDTNAMGYLNTRAAMFERLSGEQCELFMDNKLPNREAWALAAVFSDDEIKTFYSHVHEAFLHELRRVKVRSMPSTADLGEVGATLKARFDDKAWAGGGSGNARCQTTSAWLTSYKSFDGSKQQTAMTMVLGMLSQPKPAAKDKGPGASGKSDA